MEEADRLLERLYDELKVIARRALADEAKQQTLAPTALVHEAWLRLRGKDGGAEFSGRAHFLGAAARAMRRVLVERARARSRVKRGGGQFRVTLAGLEVREDVDPARLMAINDALERLEAQDPRKGRLVELRLFAGLSLEDCAETMGVSVSTVEREWRFVKSWILVEIDGDS